MKSSIQIRRLKISLGSEPSGIHMVGYGGSLLHGCKRKYLLLSIVTIQSDLRPVWTDLRPSNIRVKTPSEPNPEGHKTKTKPKFDKKPYESGIIFSAKREHPARTTYSKSQSWSLKLVVVKFRPNE